MAFPQMSAATGDAADPKGPCPAAGPGGGVSRGFPTGARLCRNGRLSAGPPDGRRPRRQRLRGGRDRDLHGQPGLCSRAVPRRPLSVLVETISHEAVPGYFLSSLDRGSLAHRGGRAVRDNAARRYFPCRSRRHPVSRPFVAAHAGLIGHGHVADHPGCHEPGTGTLDFEAFVRLIVSRGYPRAVSFEYIPSRPTAETLALTPAWKGRLRDYAGDT